MNVGQVPYKYNEDGILAELKTYIDSTYGEHYSGRKNIQVMELIAQGGHAVGFCVGAIMKYAYRYGKKDSYNRKDLVKLIHYAIILLSHHDEMEQERKGNVVSA